MSMKITKKWWKKWKKELFLLNSLSEIIID